MQVFHTEGISESDFALILSILRRGGVIGFPTDTAYGLGSDPFNEASLDRLFKIKGRTETKPILLLVTSIAMAETVSEPNPVFYQVAKQYWPGPLTMILPARTFVSAKVTAGTKTVGLRWPVSPWATKLIERFGSTITATSANRSGLPTAVTAEEVRAQLGDSIDALIDGGTLPSRSGSTLLDLTADLPVLLREGPISFESLHDFFKGEIRRQVV
jgi:L-threonylcarbamoyladenylate synthase